MINNVQYSKETYMIDYKNADCIVQLGDDQWT